MVELYSLLDNYVFRLYFIFVIVFHEKNIPRLFFYIIEKNTIPANTPVKQKPRKLQPAKNKTFTVTGVLLYVVLNT